MPKNYSAEPNILRHYFHPDSAMYLIAEALRRGFVNKDTKPVDDIGNALIESAKAEVGLVHKSLDESSFTFAQDFNKYLFQTDNINDIRVIMLVEGKFHGNDVIKRIIPFDLGSNPYTLFKGVPSDTTIDDEVTLSKVHNYFLQHGDFALGKGYTKFEVEKSRFFYLKDEDLLRLRFYKEDGSLDLIRLVPLVSSTNGYVALNKVETPTLEDYMASAPLHSSQRLKHSLAIKTLKKSRQSKLLNLVLNPNGTIISDDSITDWRGFRHIVPREEDAYTLQRILHQNPKIFNSTLEEIYYKDYYKKPKVEFKALIEISRVSTKGFQPCITEIQIVDMETYHDNEVRKGSTNHSEYERKRNQVPRGARDVHKLGSHILEQIFGKTTEVIDIKNL